MRSDPRHLDELLRSCIHCGLCLNDCPTYRMTGDEAESPRGRLMVLRQLIDPRPGESWKPDRGPLDRCMGCRGCETVCPSGVEYGRLLAEGRSTLPEPADRHARLVRMVLRHLVVHRRRLAVASMAGRLLSSRGIAVRSLARLLDSLPRRNASWPRLRGPRTGTVGILAGCAQPVFSPGVLGATIELVRAAGERPFVPRKQGCCGALLAHCGDHDRARSFGRQIIRAFEGAETILVPAAGCSAHLRELDQLFAGNPEWESRARDLAERTVDLVVWLADRGPRLRFRPDQRRVVFQRPCHLRHAQGVDGAAESVLASIEGVEVLDAPRADLCCGSAGVWSMEHPEMAAARRREKLNDLLAPSPELILTANPGCEVFLDVDENGVEVRHLAEYLAELLVRP